MVVCTIGIDVETTGRQAEALRREIEELMVEDKTMSMTEIKVSNPFIQPLALQLCTVLRGTYVSEGFLKFLFQQTIMSMGPYFSSIVHCMYYTLIHSPLYVLYSHIQPTVYVLHLSKFLYILPRPKYLTFNHFLQMYVSVICMYVFASTTSTKHMAFTKNCTEQYFNIFYF